MFKGILLSQVRYALGIAVGVGISKGLIDADTGAALTAAGVGLAGSAWAFLASRSRWISVLEHVPYLDGSDVTKAVAK